MQRKEKIRELLNIFRDLSEVDRSIVLMYAKWKRINIPAKKVAHWVGT